MSTLPFDRRASARRIKPQRVGAELRRRPDGHLPFVTDRFAAGREVMLDTSVYIDVLQGRTPAEVDLLLRTRIVNHSSVALSELTHLFGALDPAHPATKKALIEIGRTVDDIPAHRLSTPSIRSAGEAGMLAGLVSRLAGRARPAALLNDALLFLHAAETGCDLLTANVRDFDLFDQLLPGSGLLLYRVAEPQSAI